MNIIQAIKDEHLFKPFLGDDLTSWRRWMVALRAVYGLPIRSERGKRLIRKCTGRDPDKLPEEGFDTALFLTGRRSGKSRMAAVIGAFEAALAGHEQKLAKGETGVVAICAPSKKQGRIVRDYIRSIFDTPMLAGELANETKEGFELKNGIRIDILAGDFRLVRGFTLVAAVIDEAAFFGIDDEARIKSDTELIRAIEPGLATTGGRLVVISSPYAKKGFCWRTWQNHFNNDNGTILVVNCPSRTLNPTLSKTYIAKKLIEDPAGARAEFLGLFRDDVLAFIDRAMVERLVVEGRTELLPRSKDIEYAAFADLSGGRADDAAISIAHREDRTVVVDLARRWRPPFDPRWVIGEMAKLLRQYDCYRVIGDNYAAEFVAAAFRSEGVRYVKSEKPKSDLFLELLHTITSEEIELPDDEVLVNQLSSLERRTRTGGRDAIVKPPGGHDDLANAVAGVVVAALKPVLVVGAYPQADE